MLRIRHVWAVTPLILLFFWLALNSLVGDSPTMDEQNHLARGLAFLRTGDPRLSLEHPPLINTLSALPLLTLPNIRLPLADPSWGWTDGWYRFAELLLWEYNHDVGRMIFLARLPIVFLTLGLALTAYHFAREVWRKRAAGLAAFALCLWDPNVLAHGRYVTTDLGGALFLLLATWLLWRLWQRPAWDGRRWLAAGVGLGLALGSKLTSLAFGPVWLALACLPPVRQGWGWRKIGRNLLQLVSAGLVGLLVVWLIFGLQWGPFQFENAQLARLNAYAGPMPTFWAGLERILLLSSGGRPSFLLGRFSPRPLHDALPFSLLAQHLPAHFAAADAGANNSRRRHAVEERRHASAGGFFPDGGRRVFWTEHAKRPQSRLSPLAANPAVAFLLDRRPVDAALGPAPANRP